jgi:hypothetical protein
MPHKDLKGGNFRNWGSINGSHFTWEHSFPTQPLMCLHMMDIKYFNDIPHQNMKAI